ncbi:MAG: inorganic diphosphatase [bacterium]|nr:MAG: inorganic diphosphatase [bacterium]
MNLLHDIEFGKEGEYLNTFVEISRGSRNKIEYNYEPNIFVLDRVEPEIFAKPVNYGFIPQTWDEDNDPLDTLIITDEPLPTGIMVKVKVVGVLNFVDDGENDHKIICVPEDDRNTGSVITDISDLTETWKNKLEHHFAHYKDLKKPGSTKVEGWGNKDEAWKIIMASNSAYLSKFK